MKKRSLLGAILVVASLASCKKESEATDNSAASSLFGSWKFLQMDAKTVSDATITYQGDSQRTVSATEYTTVNNVGSIVFSNDKAEAKGIGYTAEGTMNGTYYENGVHNANGDLTDYPFSYDVPATSTSNSYKAVGSDSLYFSGGSLVGATDGENDISATSSGYKYKINGDTLTMTLNATAAQNQSASDVTYKIAATVNAQMKFIKE